MEARREPVYERHHPEKTPLYRLVQHYYPACLVHLKGQGKQLSNHVRREFESYLKCGRLD